MPQCPATLDGCDRAPGTCEPVGAAATALGNGNGNAKPRANSPTPSSAEHVFRTGRVPASAGHRSTPPRSNPEGGIHRGRAPTVATDLRPQLRAWQSRLHSAGASTSASHAKEDP